MKYCRFHFDGEARYGLVESVAGRDMILRILLTPPEQSDGDGEGVVIVTPSTGWWGRVVNDAGGRWDGAGGIVIVIAV